MNAAAIRDDLARGATTAVDVCRRTLDRIAAAEVLHAFQFVHRDRALERAAGIDAERGAAAALPLGGVPIALKDNICTTDAPTTAGSRILEGYYPPYDATVVRRLRDAGAVIVGKTVCDEFGMGSSTENSAYGGTKNPWALDRIPGGSSGGSAAAVAAGLVPIALGSDTGGSIRQPAALCGVVGLKPTYGRVSRYGLIAFASSLDQIGPLTRTVGDAALVMNAIAGHDPLDSTSAAVETPDYVAALTGDVRGLRIGVPRDLLRGGVDAGVIAAFDGAIDALRAAGAAIADVDLPHASLAIPVYYLIATAEASSNLARYDGVRYGRREDADTLTLMYERTRGRGFGPEVKRRIMLGTYVLSAGYYDAYYLKAQQGRTLIRRDYDRAFADVDLVAMPTSPTPAFRLGERVADPLSMYLADAFTVATNLAGLPGISVTCGFSADRLPIGFQLIGRPFDEATVLRAADVYQRATAWSAERPPHFWP